MFGIRRRHLDIEERRGEQITGLRDVGIEKVGKGLLGGQSDE